MAQNKNPYVIVGGIASIVVFALLGFWTGGSSNTDYSSPYSTIASFTNEVEEVELFSEDAEGADVVEEVAEEAVEEVAEEAW